MNIDKTIKDLNTWVSFENERYSLQQDLLEQLQVKFPNVKKIWLSSDTLEVTTKKHSIHYRNYSNYGKRWGASPVFVCDEAPVMPDTIEEFNEMKAMLKADKEECYAAGVYLAFRYNWYKGIV